jgi:hypothetical protein
LSVFLLALGLYNIIAASTSFVIGLAVLLGGVIMLILLTVILVKEYEFIKS